MGALSGTQAALTSIINRQQKDKDWVKAFALTEYIDKRTYDRTIKATELKHSRGVKAATHAEQTAVFKVGIDSLNSDLKGINSRLKELTDVFSFGSNAQQLWLQSSGFAGLEELKAERTNLRNHHQWALDKRQRLMAQLARHTGYTLADTSVYPGPGGADRTVREKLTDYDPTGTLDPRLPTGQATSTVPTPVVPTATYVPSAVEPGIDDNRAVEQQVEKLKRKNLVAEEKKKIVEELAQFALGGEGSDRRKKLAGILLRPKDNDLDKNIDRLLIDYLKGVPWGKKFLQEYEIIPGDAEIDESDDRWGTPNERALRRLQIINAPKQLSPRDDKFYEMNKPLINRILRARNQPLDSEDADTLLTQEYEAGQTPRLWEQEFEAGQVTMPDDSPGAGYQLWDELSAVEDAWDPSSRLRGWDKRRAQGLIPAYQHWDEVSPYEDAPLEWPQDYKGFDPKYGLIPRAITEDAALAEVSGERWTTDYGRDLPENLQQERAAEARRRDYIDPLLRIIDENKKYVDEAAAISGGAYLTYQGLAALNHAFLSPEQKELKALLRERIAAKKNPKKYGIWGKKKDKQITALENNITQAKQDKARIAKGKRGGPDWKPKTIPSIPWVVKTALQITAGLALLGYSLYSGASQDVEELVKDAASGDKKATDTLGSLKIIADVAIGLAGATAEIAAGVAGSPGSSTPQHLRMTGQEPYRIPHTTTPQYGQQAYRGPFPAEAKESSLDKLNALREINAEGLVQALATGQIDVNNEAIQELRSQGGLTEKQYRRLLDPNVSERVKKYLVEKALSTMDERMSLIPSGYPTATEAKAAAVFGVITRLIMKAESSTEMFPDGGDYNAVAFDPGRKARKSDRAVTQNTVGQNAKQFGESKGLGAYQMDVHHMETLVIKYMGQNKKWLYSQSFSPEFQDQMFYLSALNAGMMELVTGEFTIDQFYQNLGRWWPSLPGPNQKRGDVTVKENRVTVDRADLLGIINLEVPAGLLLRSVD